MDREKKKNKNTIQNKNTAAGVKLWWGDGEREKYDFKNGENRLFKLQIV